MNDKTPQAARGLTREQLLRAADACERAATADDIQQERRAVLDIIEQQHVIQVGLMQAQMRSLSQVPRTEERLPLRVEGEDWGVYKARIPKGIAMQLMTQKNFGQDGLFDDRELEGFLQNNPAFRVKTVSGKTTVGYTGRTGRSGRVKFGRGTLVLAQ